MFDYLILVCKRADCLQLASSLGIKRQGHQSVNFSSMESIDLCIQEIAKFLHKQMCWPCYGVIDQSFDYCDL